MYLRKCLCNVLSICAYRVVTKPSGNRRDDAAIANKETIACVSNVGEHSSMGGVSGKLSAYANDL